MNYCLFHVRCRDDHLTCTKVYNVLSLSSSNTIRIDCGSCSIVNPFIPWQKFEPKLLFTLLNKGFAEKKIGYRFAMGKLTQPSCKYELWSLRDTDSVRNWNTIPNIKHYRVNLLCININSYTGKKCIRFSNYGIV